MCVTGRLLGAQETPSGVGATRSAVHAGRGQDIGASCQLVTDKGDLEAAGSESRKWHWVAYTRCLADLTIYVCSRDGTGALTGARSGCG